MIYYQDEHFLVEWDALNRWVKTTIKGFVEGEARWLGNLKMLELMRQKGATKLLYDYRLGGVISQQDQQWINEVSIPQAVQAGLRFSALVLPPSVIAQLAVKGISGRKNNVARAPHTALFSELLEAQAWLRSQK